MATIKIKTDDGVQEFDQSQIVGVPDGFVKDSVHEAKMEQRAKRARESAMQKAIESEDAQQHWKKEWNLELDDEGKRVQDDDKIDIDREREKWEGQYLEPVKNKLEEFKNENNQLRSGRVEDAVMSGFAPKFKDGFNNERFIKNTYGPLFKYNKDLNKSLQVDDNGEFEMHPKGKSANGHGYIEPDDYVELNKDSDDVLKTALKDETQGGSGFNSGGSGKRTFSEQEIANMSPDEYAQNRDKILGSS